MEQDNGGKGSHRLIAIALPSTSRRRILLAVALILPIGLGGIVFTLTSTHTSHALLAALYYAYLSSFAVAVAAYWWTHRPGSRMGLLLYLFAVCAALTSWESANQSLPFTIGVWAGAPLTVLIFTLPVAYPSGRLTSRVDRWLIGGFLLGIGLTFVPWVLSSPNIHGNPPLVACETGCPSNAFLLLSISDSWRDLLGAAGSAVIALVAIGLVTNFLIRRRRRPSAIRRATAALAASLLLLPVLIVFVVSSVVLATSDPLRETATVALMLALLLFPLGFALPLLQADLSAAGTLRQLLTDVATDPAPQPWRNRLATALDDPDLRYGYWRAGTQRYAGPDGADAADGPPAGSRQWIPVEHHGQPSSSIAIDPSIELSPELEQAVAVATALAVTTERSRDERTELELRAAQAAENEREHMAREVQAGTQQRLAAMRIQLTLASDAGGRNADGLAEVGRDLDLAIQELRDLIVTPQPATVTRGGVGRALRAVTRRAAITVRVYDHDLHRHPAEAELAVYYCCLEAIQNAVKHAGPAAQVMIRLADDKPDGIRFTVSDNGRGFDLRSTQRGSGLRNMRDRVTAMGGTLTVSSGESSGTVIAGSVRDAPPERWVGGGLHPNQAAW